MLRVRVTDILPSVIQQLGVKHHKRKQTYFLTLPLGGYSNEDNLSAHASL